ncbi:MAG: G8 domain-containing protein [Planctomycetes bacterium]|nr:G8 domain-containing protein [Planctomycetota bacterium]
MPRSAYWVFGGLLSLGGSSAWALAGVQLDARTARSGSWSDAATWEGGRVPRAGDRVQVRPGHRVTYDVLSDGAFRMVHVAGVLTFARDRSTRLEVGLLRIEAGEEAAEDGFECDAHAAENGDRESEAQRGEGAALEIGTREIPIPAGVTATIRLVHFAGMDPDTLPAIVNCGGRWDAHGAPLSRTWVKLGRTTKPGDSRIVLAEDVTGWRVGGRVIVTGSSSEPLRTFRRRPDGSGPGETEERSIAAIDGRAIDLDRPLEKAHLGQGETRCEVANLSRSVVIESAAPGGTRGHTMYHRGSSGSISYAELRHLGKEGVLGKYPIHFHRVRDSMRGSSVVGASIWDSHNRWVTVHGTDYLVVRDCVGYQSVGHGFFLEDATEVHNVLDRNLAVQAYEGKRLPEQVLPFDPNDGAGFWWANGRNVLTRNVSCENDEYGYRFEIAQRSDFDPQLRVRLPGGAYERRDVRKIPFLRFEDNESHSEGLYSFNFGDDVHPSVSGDRQHPFIARRLRAWKTHYALRPNVQFFLMEGLRVHDAAYGVYHPDYDAHVYRDILLSRVNAEPINRGHDDESIQYGTFTYEDVTLEGCRLGRDPLIQLACTGPSQGLAGHFRNLKLLDSGSRSANVVDLGGGPRNGKLQNGVVYYFHDLPAKGQITKVVSVKFGELMKDGEYGPVVGFTGKDVRAATVSGVELPRLLEPVDDLPPATVITSVRRSETGLIVGGISHDDGELASVMVNGRAARIVSLSAGVADWEAEIQVPAGGEVIAGAADVAGNVEATPHRLRIGPRTGGGRRARL